MMHLTDCFVELIAYVAYTTRTIDRKQPPYEQVKNDIQRMISESESRFSRSSFSQEDYEQARFAVFAWIDETILSSSWKEKDRWQVEKLQYRYYDTGDAGELFFEKLNRLGPHQRDVREVYYLCLAMGFKGQYHSDGDRFLLDNLKDANLKLLTGSSVSLPSLEKETLFSEAYPADREDYDPARNRSLRFGPFALLCIGFPVVLYTVMFFIYRFSLGNAGRNLVDMVP